MGLSCGLENITVIIYFDVQFGHQEPLQSVCSFTGALGAFNKKTNWNSVIFSGFSCTFLSVALEWTVFSRIPVPFAWRILLRRQGLCLSVITADSGSGRKRMRGVSVCVHVHTGTHMHKGNNLYEDACLYLYFLSSFSISVFGMPFPDSAKPTAYFLNVVFQAGKKGGRWIKLWENRLADALFFCSYKRARKAEISLGSAFFISKPVMAIVCCKWRLRFCFPVTETWKITQKLY